MITTQHLKTTKKDTLDFSQDNIIQRHIKTNHRIIKNKTHCIKLPLFQ